MVDSATNKVVLQGEVLNVYGQDGWAVRSYLVRFYSKAPLKDQQSGEYGLKIVRPSMLVKTLEEPPAIGDIVKITGYISRYGDSTTITEESREFIGKAEPSQQNNNRGGYRKGSGGNYQKNNSGGNYQRRNTQTTEARTPPPDDDVDFSDIEIPF